MLTPARGWSFFTAFAGAVTGAVLGGWMTRAPEVRVDPGAAASAAQTFQAALRSAAPGAPAAIACPPPAALAPAAQSALAEQIATLVRGRLDAPRPPEPTATASPEALAARSDAEALLDRALSARQWTEQDGLALRPLLPRLAGPDLDELVRALNRAINEGRVTLLTEGPLF